MVHQRLIDDRLFDTPDARLRTSGCALRVRTDGVAGALTFKGPVDPSQAVKAREEIETTVGSAAVATAIVLALGFHLAFRAQKRREEYELGAAHVVIDDTPMGVFVEIEAMPEEIARVTRLLGLTVADYQLDSYVALWRRWCARTGADPARMLLSGAPDA